MDILRELFPTVNVYNVFLLVPVGVLCYAVIRRLHAKMMKRSYEARSINRHYTYSKDISIYTGKKFPLSAEFLKRTDDMLRKQGNPLGLTVSSYYIVKSCMFMSLFAAGIFNYTSFVMGLILGVFGFILIDIYIWLNKRLRDSQINNDLLDVVETLYLQMSAYVSLKEALRGLHEVCRNKDFKKALIRLSATYELSEMNIERAANQLKESFDLIEIDMFAAALKQQIIMGSSLEVLNNLSRILKENYLDKLNIKTKVKILYITLGVTLVLVNIMALTFYPIFINVGETMRDIFM